MACVILRDVLFLLIKNVDFYFLNLFSNYSVNSSYFSRINSKLLQILSVKNSWLSTRPQQLLLMIFLRYNQTKIVFFPVLDVCKVRRSAHSKTKMSIISSVLETGNIMMAIVFEINLVYQPY